MFNEKPSPKNQPVIAPDDVMSLMGGRCSCNKIADGDVFVVVVDDVVDIVMLSKELSGIGASNFAGFSFTDSTLYDFLEISFQKFQYFQRFLVLKLFVPFF